MKDIVAVSVPIYDGKKDVVADLSVLIPIVRFDDNAEQQILPRLKKAAQQISIKLGYWKEPDDSHFQNTRNIIKIID